MGEIHVSMTTLRQRLGDLVNRAAYGGERIWSAGRLRRSLSGAGRDGRLPILDC